MSRSKELNGTWCCQLLFSSYSLQLRSNALLQIKMLPLSRDDFFSRKALCYMFVWSGVWTLCTNGSSQSNLAANYYLVACSAAVEIPRPFANQNATFKTHSRDIFFQKSIMLHVCLIWSLVACSVAQSCLSELESVKLYCRIELCFRDHP